MLITPRATFEFDEGEMTLTGLMEGTTAAEATEGFPWDPPRRPVLDSIPPPSEEELEIEGVLAAHHHPDHVGGEPVGACVSGARDVLESSAVPAVRTIGICLRRS